MNDLDELIAEAEALVRSTRDELLAGGEQESRLASLAAELANTVEPTGDERDSFGRIYELVTGRTPRFLSPWVPRCELTAPRFNGMFGPAESNTTWRYDHCDWTLRWQVADFAFAEFDQAAQPLFTHVLADSGDLMRHLDHELRRATEEILVLAYGFETSIAAILPRGSSRSMQVRCIKMGAYTDPLAFIDPARLRQVVFDAACGASHDHACDDASRFSSTRAADGQTARQVHGARRDEP